MKLDLTKKNVEALGWKVFVATYVAMMTAKKSNRDLVRGYQVKKISGGWTITHSGRDSGYGAMDAETLYSWLERLPLRYFQSEADEVRYEILTAS